ncbi:Protein kinase PCTAIRE [Pseudoloma neurophilia]|uniref:Cyclin-dependent kinase 1 n=1 Tax=Pseudoloma neurophilia TaxID=146866 RepID=A0A0R0M2B1_9MICR|nr:Protein kinase PCTAIRE [Pseudoloma neurophilia]
MPSTDSYKRLEKIGEGTYGIVYRAIHKQSKNIVALKKIRPENEEDGVSPTTLREIAILKSISNVNIIKILDIMCNDRHIYIVYEYCQTDLRKLLDSYKSTGKKLTFDFKQNLSRQILEGVLFLHKKQIFHRDLKPQNILITNNNVIKLADFGLSRKVHLPLRSLTKDVITLWYRPPELLLGCEIYNSSIDIWSYGCIIAEIVNLQPLFPGDSEIDQLVKIFTILGTPLSNTWKDVAFLREYQENFPKYKPICLSKFINDKFFLKLIEECLRYDPIKRLPACELIKLFDHDKENQKPFF